MHNVTHSIIKQDLKGTNPNRNNNNNGGFNSNYSGGGYSNTEGYSPNSDSQFQNFNQSKSSSNQGQSQSNRPTCQIYGKNGHLAINCYHCMDFAYQGRHAPAKLASMVANVAQV